MNDKAIATLKEDIIIGAGKKAITYGVKGDKVEVERRGNSDIYVATHLKTKEKFAVTKNQIGL